MDAQEIKDRLQGVINALIKDNQEEASKELHDVLAAKMRSRISPEEAVDEPAGDDPAATGDENKAVATVGDPTGAE